MKRRTFLRTALTAAAMMSAAGRPFVSRAEDAAEGLETPGAAPVEGEDERFVQPAMFYDATEDGLTECRLCPRGCVLSDGDRGVCGVRENRDGQLFTLVHGRAVALNNDPIEKKPFNHFKPGTLVMSAATAGCNLACKFCQNWQISQFAPEEVRARYLSPQTLIDMARELESPSVALTYSEPSIFYEYMYDVARTAYEAGLSCVVVSNGFINPEPVVKLAPFLGAYKIDLKGFTESFYRDYCGAHLDPVKRTLETLAATGLWFEIVNLVLPTANDDLDTVHDMAAWIKSALGEMVPVHFTRFRPMYKMLNLPPTPIVTLEECRAAAMDAGLRYAYVGNAPGHPFGSTYCHNCGQLVVERTGLWAVDVLLEEGGRCPICHTVIPGVWA